MDTQNFRLTLKTELAKRIRENPSYSLRSMAQHLGVHSGSLSQIISGKRPLSMTMAKKFAEKLNLDPSRVKALYIQKNHSPSVTLREDQFDMLQDWVHFAILSMLHLDDFRPDVKWMAQRLGLAVVRVEDCLDRLIRLGFVEESEDGDLIDVREKGTFYGDGPETALLRKNLQKNWFQKAVDAIDDVEVEKRSHSGSTICIDHDQLPEAMNRIHKFRADMEKFFRNGNKSDDVYHLSVGLFPLTKREEK